MRSVSQPEDLSEKFLKTQRHVSIAVVVIFLEHIRHAFQTDAGLHKQVKVHALTLGMTSVVEGIVQDSDERL